MKKLSVLLGGIVLLLVGCGLNQDPLANKANEVKNVQAPQGKVEIPAPERSDAIRINAVPKYTFSEGREGRFSIMSSVLASDYEVVTQITNDVDFPNSKFDAATGEFIWTPPKGLVFDGLSKTMEMKVRVFAKHVTDSGAKVFTNEKTIEIVVERAMDKPVITSVTGVPMDGFVEGEVATFSVLVHDEDAGPASETFPRLELIHPEYGSVTLAPYIRIVRVTPDFQKRDFVFELSLDAEGALVDGYASAGFGLRAVSRYNKVSSVESINTKLLAKFGNLKISWLDEITIPTGLTYNYSFFIFESTSRADFQVIKKEGLPDGASIECIEYDAKGYIPCNLKWKVSAQENLGPSEISFKVKAFKRYYNEVKAVEQEFSLKYKVVKGPVASVPTPTPNPPVEPPSEEEGNQ